MKNLLLASIDPTLYVFAALLVIFAVMIVMQNKRRKTAQTQVTDMLDGLRAGMRIKTVGGIIGRIKEIREEAPGFKTVTIETGSAKNASTMTFDINAIYGVINDEAVAGLAAKSTAEASAEPVLLNGEPMDTGFDAKTYVEKSTKASKKGTSKAK